MDSVYSGSWRLRRSTAWSEIDLADEIDLRHPRGMQFPQRFQIDKRHSMSKTVTVCNLAALVEAWKPADVQRVLPRSSRTALIAAAAEDDHSLGCSDEELRALIDEADAIGPAEPWDAAAVKAEVLRRYAFY
jgi:hypothetical protein